MSRHFTKEENEEFFSKYTKNGRFSAIRKMKEISPSLYQSQRDWKKSFYIINTGMKELLVDRKREITENQVLTEPDWSKVKIEEFIEIAKSYHEIIKNFPKDAKREEAKELNIRINIIAWLLNITRQTVSKIRKYPEITKKVTKKPELEQHKEKIIKAFNENKGIYGRVRLSMFLAQKYQIFINYRTLGNYMNDLNLKCKVRIKKREH